MPAIRPAAEPSKWRFSLKTLFLLMLLTSVVVWLTSWPIWDLDERIILGSWFIAVVGAIARSRHRGRRGLLLSAVGGGLMPAVLVLAYYLFSLAPWAYYTDIVQHEIPMSVIAVAIAGALSGALLAAAFTPRGLAELSPSQREDWLQRRLIIFSGLSLLLVLGVGAWSLYGRATEWTHRGGLWRESFSSVYSRNVTFELCADGSHLQVIAPAKEKTNQLMLFIWKLKPFDADPVLSIPLPAESGTAWTSDGEWLAIAELVDDQAKISVRRTVPDSSIMRLTVPAPSDSWDEGTVSFSSDDRTLRFVMRQDEVPDVSQSFQWRVNSWERLPDQAGIEVDAARPMRSVEVVQLPNVGPFNDEQYQVEVWEPDTDQPLCTFGPFSDPFPVVLSPDGKQLATGASLIDLSTKAVRELSAVVEEFLPDGQLLCSQKREREWQKQVPLPFLRQIWGSRRFERMLLLDADSGRVVSRSQWIHGELGRLIVSDNGKVVITIDAFSVHVWEIRQ